MKKIFVLLLTLLMLVATCACTSKEAKEEKISADYEEAQFEEALGNGYDLTDKSVIFTVSEVAPQSAFGYNLQSGEHLNFCSTGNPGAKAGDKVYVKVDSVQYYLGSYIIYYSNLKILN